MPSPIFMSIKNTMCFICTYGLTSQTSEPNQVYFCRLLRFLQVQEEHQGAVHCPPHHVHQDSSHPLQASHQVSIPAPEMLFIPLTVKCLPCVMIPFFSSFKFGRKINYINYLSELEDIVKCEQLVIPTRVRE